MPTQAELDSWAGEVDSLAVLLSAEFTSQVTDLAVLDPSTAAGLMRDLATELAVEYGKAAAAISAEWYELLRPEGDFTAILADPDLSRLQQDLSWSLNPLFGDEPDVPKAATLSAQVTDLAVTDAGRGTVITNMRRDPLDVRYARHASANACAFCAMLATRQATYRSKETAGIKSHRSCHCIAVPVWPGQSIEEPPYVAGWRDAYHQARKTQGGDTKAILAEMRRTAGLR